LHLCEPFRDQGYPARTSRKRKTRARGLFDRVAKGLEIESANANGLATVRSIADDVEMQIEVARLWQGENLERMGKALKEALRISQASGETNPRLVNNIAVLHHLEGNLIEARTMYESALTSVTTLPVDNAEALSTTVLYNLARVYEDQGEETFARDAYDKLLSRHPEYVDGMFRLINPTNK
jgi:RNA polymerase-associated protein CTR9